MRRSFSNTLRVAALLLTTIVVCLVAAEVVVRLRYGDKFGPRPAFYTAEQRLGWKPTANLDNVFYGPDYEIAIRTDADGYRLGTLGPVDYTKDLVVLCGDSYAFGWGVSTGQSFASNLDSLLSSSTQGRVRAVNLGVGGYGTFQECSRLADFLRVHGEARPKVIILQHSVNDATDNVRNIGYHFAYWQTETVEQKRSRIHLVNLARYLREARASTQDAPASKASEAYMQDMLWGFRRAKEYGYPDKLRFGNVTLRIPAHSLYAEISADSLAQRRKLSDAQRVLMLEALNCFHRTALATHVTVVHTFIATTPDWYVEDVSGIVRASADSTQCPVAITGAMPRPQDFGGPVRNAHSGGHFNPEFNRFWAQTIIQWLEDQNLLATS